MVKVKKKPEIESEPLIEVKKEEEIITWAENEAYKIYDLIENLK